MKLYADRPVRVLRQLFGDLLVVIAVYWAVRLGQGTHAKVGALAAPGREAEQSARALDGKLRDTAGNLRDTPLVGDTIASPFRDLAATSRDLAASAQDYQDSVERLAIMAGIMVAAVPIIVLLVLWLPHRLAWVVEASAASRLLRRSPAAAELLAVRALARQPLRRLARLEPHVVADWKVGDLAATEELAQLELDELGLRY